MTENKTAIVTIRISGPKKAKAIKAAAADGRKLAPWIERLIDRELKEGKTK